ncbi:MAG: hypothetical protein VYC11_00480 [Candidatus Thermoplasmatota archaeon]|nr:hypothetical protein [Candidatus Thermoplasmatota archaeon]
MSDYLTTLDGLRTTIDKKVKKSRDHRENWNSKTREHLGTRNTFNSQVRELITEVQRQKVIRDEANAAVREAKDLRAQKNAQVKEAKEQLRQLSGGEPEQQERGGRRGKRDRPDTPAMLRRKIEVLEREFEMGKHTGKNEKKAMHRMQMMKRKLRDMAEKEDSNVDLRDARVKLRTAIDEQEEAHNAVTTAADNAQQAHDLMIKISEEVDRLREKADSSQSQVRRSKKEADNAHQTYIVSLRCLHSIQDILRAKKNKDSGISETSSSDSGARVEVQDLMSKLMSGEKLTTDELMALQRGG